MRKINKSLQEECPKEKSNKTDNSNYILGTVINSKDKTVIFGASIHIWSSVSKASVKSNGNFFLTIPDFLKTDSILLEIRHAIYE